MSVRSNKEGLNPVLSVWKEGDPRAERGILKVLFFPVSRKGVCVVAKGYRNGGMYRARGNGPFFFVFLFFPSPGLGGGGVLRHPGRGREQERLVLG